MNKHLLLEIFNTTYFFVETRLDDRFFFCFTKQRRIFVVLFVQIGFWVLFKVCFWKLAATFYENCYFCTMLIRICFSLKERPVCYICSIKQVLKTSQFYKVWQAVILWEKKPPPSLLPRCGIQSFFPTFLEFLKSNRGLKITYNLANMKKKFKQSLEKSSFFTQNISQITAKRNSGVKQFMNFKIYKLQNLLENNVCTLCIVKFYIICESQSLLLYLSSFMKSTASRPGPLAA